MVRNGTIVLITALILLLLRGILVEKMTRKQKREKQKEINFFGEFTKIKNHFFKDINSKLLGVEDRRHQSYIEYTPDIYVFEKKQAPTIIKTGELSIFTMPENLVESIILRIGRVKTNAMMDYYKNRVLAFKNNIENHRFVEIIRMPDIEQIIEGKANIGFSYTFYDENIYYTLSEFKDHLENIVYFLQNSSNYHIYFDEKEENQKYNFYAKEDIGIMVGKESDSSVFLKIDESNVTGAFWDYLNYEMNLGEINKTNKDMVISKLKEIIYKLSL